MFDRIARGIPFLFAPIGVTILGCNKGDDKRVKELESENASLKKELAKLETVTLEGEEFLEFPKEGKPPNEMLVYYKLPFATPPYLTFPQGMVFGYKVTEQKADCFKLERTLSAEEKSQSPKLGLQVGAVPPQEIFAKSKQKWKAEGRPAK